MGLVIRQFVYRQLEFAQRKSLLKWQREVLSEWIEENLSHLMDMGLLDEPLQNEIARLRAFEMGIVLDTAGAPVLAQSSIKVAMSGLDSAAFFANGCSAATAM